MLGVIILIYEKLRVIMRAEILKNSNNLFKQLFFKALLMLCAELVL
jgi:hypothetical protein